MTQTKKSTRPSPTGEPRFRLPEGLLRLNKRMLEGQRTLFESGYGTWSALRESQESALHGFLDNASIVPTELKEIAHAWTDVSRQSRQEYKETVEKSFALLEKWFDTLGARDTVGADSKAQA